MRVDALQSDIRRRGRSWDRAIYFGLVGVFLVWIFDIFAGDYVYLRADGLVLRDRVVLATQFTAQVAKLGVVEGSELKKGDVVAQLRSQEVYESLAKLSSEIAVATGRRTQLGVRQSVIEAVRASAEQSFRTAHVHRVKSEPLIGRSIISNREVSELLASEYKTGQTLAEMDAEATGLKQDLPRLDASIAEAVLARATLKEIYSDGKIESPVGGIVGSLPVRTGSVLRIGDPLMEIFTGESYVLAYVPEGALYDLSPDDRVNIRVGLRTYDGRVSKILPVTSQLPKEFQDSLRPPARAQVVRISFDPGQRPPTLFAKPRISMAVWWQFFRPVSRVLFGFSDS
jgi:multidrug resistance efflux pump